MYADIFNGFINPLYEKLIKRRQTYSHYDYLMKTQHLSAKEATQQSLSNLRRLLVHAAENSHYYNKKIDKKELSSLQDVELPSFFDGIPFLTKEIINKHRADLVAGNYRQLLWKKSTGGSTGVPLHFYYTKDSNDWRVACTWRGYGWAGAHLGVKQAYIWGTHIGDIPFFKKIKEKMHHQLLRQRYYNCFNFSEIAMTESLNDINRFRPEVIVGYTNPLFAFASFIKENNLTINWPLKSVVTAAEGLYDYQRELIEEVFRAKVFHTYGSREFMLIASECEKHEGLHVNTENIFLEIVRGDGSVASPGEVGEIVVTDLHNYGMPFIRYKIGDMGVMSTSECSCGRGLPMLKRVVGRSLDMLKTRTGKLIPGEFFPHFFKDFVEIRQFQVVQNSLDIVEIKLVVNDHQHLSPEKTKLINKEVAKLVGNEINVRYNYVAEIPLTPTGKRRVTVCNI